MQQLQETGNIIILILHMRLRHEKSKVTQQRNGRDKIQTHAVLLHSSHLTTPHHYSQGLEKWEISANEITLH